MKFGNRVSEELEGVQLAPLIDIVFITLLYFMTTTVYTAMESEIDVKLPTASQAQMDNRSQGEIFINLTSDGKIIVNDRELTLEQLQGVLDRVAELFPGGSIIIRGDKSAMLGRAIAILNCCKNADIDNVSFAALPEEPEGSS
ncbi:MAG TPA: biopolymer transporter ExbD [Candidatus Hydrogenedentes bacterium]|nr:biopolymer transporter ExbD [Candidatus Hydrogenedentota bacterium]HQE83270.1 biopolymer transporter ExbD [Candidatus Hydrogenedentota bacterium]HQH53869.1 biopolymer transporter ExbD [Candidatus Hydrogenedentota bacterium]HQM49263.1 biopolymer transporter ExbD [Candidatus Hydrogenedentota bacterium]